MVFLRLMTFFLSHGMPGFFFEFSVRILAFRIWELELYLNGGLGGESMAEHAPLGPLVFSASMF